MLRNGNEGRAQLDIRVSPSPVNPSPLVIQGSARARALRCPRPAPRSGFRSPLVHHRKGKPLKGCWVQGQWHRDPLWGVLLPLPLHPQPFNEIGWVIIYRLRPLLQAAFRYSAFRFKQWPARSLIAPAPSHRHITSIAPFSIALGCSGLAARSGPALPSPCGSLWLPIAMSPPSQGKSGWVIFYRLARCSRRAPRGQAFSRI